MKRKINSVVILWSICMMLCGCTFSKASDEKIREMAYSVAAEEDLPEEIIKIIDSKKENAFQLAYHTEEATFIILGYGTKETTGYHIQVNEVYEGQDSVWVDTDLIGPKKTENVEQKPSYPYIIIKTETIDQLIRFKN